MSRNGSVNQSVILASFLREAVLCLSFSRWHILHRLQPSLLAIRFSGLYSCPFGQWVFALCLAPFAFPPKDKPVLSIFLCGKSISSMLRPFLTRFVMLSDFSPRSFANKAGTISTPSIKKRFTTSLFICCSCLDAHLQFSGKYPFWLSIRSSVNPLGLSPMSATKA